MLPFTKIHLVELAIEIFSTNQEITTAAVSSLRTGTSDTSDFTEYLSANWNLFLKCTLLYFSMTKMCHTALLTEWLQTPTKGLPILYQVQKHFMAACISNICWGEENNVVCGGRKQKPLSCIDQKKLSNCPLFSTLLRQHHWLTVTKGIQPAELEKVVKRCYPQLRVILALVTLLTLCTWWFHLILRLLRKGHAAWDQGVLDKLIWEEKGQIWQWTGRFAEVPKSTNSDLIDLIIDCK